MEWDKLRIFYAVVDAGSFTHAAEALNVNQSSVSRQMRKLEEELGVTLFHRHARGLTLTEPGALLYRTVQDVFNRLQTVQARMVDAKAKPFGDLRVTTPVGLGATWLTPRLPEFLELYPDIKLQLLLDNTELDLTQNEADVAIWLRAPTQGDLIQRKLFTVHLHVYASTSYIKRAGQPRTLEELDDHPILTFGGAPAPIKQLNWLEYAGRPANNPRVPQLQVNSLYALKLAVQEGGGIAMLPDYMARNDRDLIPLLRDQDMPELHTYFVFPEALRNSKRVTVFRDFLLRKARQWSF